MSIQIILPAVFGTVHCETLIPVPFACLWRPPLMIVWAPVYHVKVVLDESGTARRVHSLEQRRQTCLGVFLPGLKMPAPAQEWWGCLGRQPFITRKQGGLAALCVNVEGMIGGVGRRMGCCWQNAVV